VTLQKDETLSRLSEHANIAQFVSFGPGTVVKQRLWRLRGIAPDQSYGTPGDAIEALLVRSLNGSVNVRSYDPLSPHGRELLVGLRSRDEVLAAVTRLAREGLHTIVNETIDVNDGGVSGVAAGDLVEFAPGDTPRCVEKPGTAALRRPLALHVLRTVYGFDPALGYEPDERVEFSLHPVRVGYRGEHTVVWQLDRVDTEDLRASLRWPNRFSRYLGDKAFGLLVADALGLRVPATTVISRAVAPFSFGHSTGTAETWIRTCPAEQQPGRFSTQHGWRDPFRLLEEEDPAGAAIVSVLAQEGVDAVFSGASLPREDNEQYIEGVSGYGDRFMLGEAPPAKLPTTIVADVEELARHVAAQLGPVRLEWVHDGVIAWVVQLHLSQHHGDVAVIYPGEADRWRPFDPDEGLEALRVLVDAVRGSGQGIEVTRPVGLTSHVGDLLRTARVPSRLAATIE
jgi:hypothetical protein